jgi:hypothetical protein
MLPYIAAPWILWVGKYLKLLDSGELFVGIEARIIGMISEQGLIWLVFDEDIEYHRRIMGII